MKKLLPLFLVLCIISAMGVTAFADRPVKLFVGGDPVASDVPPKVVDGRTMLPLRAAFEAIGAFVAWDDVAQTVYAIKDDTEIELAIGSNTMLVNGVPKTLDVAAYLENGRTMVPVRACAEAFGLQVDWFPDANTVKVRMEVDVESEVDYNDGSKLWHSYDANGNYTEYNDNIGDHSHREYIYDSNDNLIEYKNKYNDWCKYEYDSYGNLITETNSYGDKFTYAYDEQNRMIYKETNSGETEEVSYNDEKGYFKIFYSNDKRGKNYKSETKQYSDVDNLTTWHIFYPFDYYVVTDKPSSFNKIKALDESVAERTYDDDTGYLVITTKTYVYTFNEQEQIIRICNLQGNTASVSDYVRDADGHLLYIDCYYPTEPSLPHTIQRFKTIIR
ncbi:MAG: hypothetical protein IKW02_00915 [Clostridia bacterium]|nr:hypothetical protein [Clostridia bacterium]